MSTLSESEFSSFSSFQSAPFMIQKCNMSFELQPSPTFQYTHIQAKALLYNFILLILNSDHYFSMSTIVIIISGHIMLCIIIWLLCMFRAGQYYNIIDIVNHDIKHHNNRYRREIFSIVISVAQYYQIIVVRESI